MPGDENADHNVPRNLRMAFSPAECTGGSGVVTPCAPGMPRHLLSPDTSVGSVTSDRLSQLAVRTVSHRHLSSKEREQKEIEEKRRDLQELMRRNQLSCRRAIDNPDASLAGRMHHPGRLREITVPRAFSLSGTPRTPGTPLMPITPRTARTEGSSPSADSPLLSRSQKLKLLATMTRKPTPTKQRWTPNLTVPKGPELQTSHRSSLILRSFSCPPPEETGAGDIETGQDSVCATAARLFRGSTPLKQRSKESSSTHINTGRVGSESARFVRPGTPDKPKIRVIAAAARAERRVSNVGVLVASATFPSSSKEQSAPGGPEAAAGNPCPELERPPPSAPAHSDGRRKPGGVDTPQERAHRARLLAQQNKDEEARAARQKVGLFKKSAAAPETSRPLVRPPKELEPPSRATLRVSTSAPGKLGMRSSFGSTTARHCLK